MLNTFWVKWTCFNPVGISVWLQWESGPDDEATPMLALCSDSHCFREFASCSLFHTKLPPSISKPINSHCSHQILGWCASSEWKEGVRDANLSRALWIGSLHGWRVQIITCGSIPDGRFDIGPHTRISHQSLFGFYLMAILDIVHQISFCMFGVFIFYLF